MRFTRTFFFLISGACLFFTLGPVAVIPAQTNTELKEAPIQIEADRMESRQKKDTVQFSGNVVAQQADLTIQADRMTVAYNPANRTPRNKAVARKIKKLFAKGHVKIIKENWIATGDAMEFDPTPKKVLLTGNAKVWQNQNMVSGQSITLFLDEGRSIIEKGEQGGGRVKAFIYPGAKGVNEKQQ